MSASDFAKSLIEATVKAKESHDRSVSDRTTRNFPNKRKGIQADSAKFAVLGINEIDDTVNDPEVRRARIFDIAVAITGVDLNDQTTWPKSPNAGCSRCQKSPFCSKPARHR